MESYFLSDIHLKNMNERNGQILLRFLHSLTDKDPNQIQLFFMGDIFDLWVSNGRVFVQKYKSLVDVVKQLTDKGVKIYFFEGNHDLHIDPYWEKVLKVKVFVDPQYLKIGRLTVRLEHGDLINLDDKNYLKLRATLRHPIVETIGHLMPGNVWEEIGKLWSPRSRKKSSNYKVRNQEKLIEMIRLHAMRSFNEKPFDLIITGHMHVRDDHQIMINNNQVRSVNLGSWFENEVYVLKIDNDAIEWVKLFSS